MNEQLKAAQAYWDNEAITFDNELDHGLNDPTVLAAWTELIASWQPSPPATILDIGCGTGSLSLVLARLGHQVAGIDLSPKMIAAATAKAAKAGLRPSNQPTFQVMEASRPHFAPQSFHGLVCRHVLWMMPSLKEALQNWTTLLQPNGRLLLVEGYWHTGGGLHAEEIVAALPASLTNVSIVNLSNRASFWGKEVADERYAIMAEL